MNPTDAQGPGRDERPVDGPIGPGPTLRASARLLGRYQWIEMRLFELLGRWLPAVPEAEVKLLFGRHGRHHAGHAEQWHTLLPDASGVAEAAELVAAPDEGFEALVEAVAAPREAGLTIEKLVGVFRVLLPRLIDAYSSHLVVARPVAEMPTIRVLRSVLADEQDHLREGEALLGSLLGARELSERAARHEADLEVLAERVAPITL